MTKRYSIIKIWAQNIVIMFIIRTNMMVDKVDSTVNVIHNSNKNSLHLGNLTLRF